jgi:diguanylate cyclase (GGDEF)-like protein/PAS domain S-box-containing protein
MTTKIMVVEDESIVALNLQRRLIRLGYDVPCIAASHDQALRGVAQTNPHLVLMDINISGDIDGIDTAAKLNVPVIYLTAYSEEKMLERAKATKPYGYLLKPFSERELHATIQMALQRHEVEQCLINSEQQLALAYATMEADKLALEIGASELFQQKERLLVTLNSIGDGVVTTDDLGKVTYLNPIAEALTGWKTAEACGQPVSQVLVLVDEETGAPARSPIETVLHSGKALGLTGKNILINKDGGTYFIKESAAPICDRDGSILGVVLVFHDVSAARLLTAEMTHQATHDALTGLVNRAEFDKRLEKAILNAAQFGHESALAYLDLDQFKIVNDTCGHAAGDALLRQITGLLWPSIRATDTLARLGGDEFGVLLECCPLDAALKVAENLKNAVGDFRFILGGRTFPVSVSIGLVSFGGRGSKKRMALKDILSLADSACYAAKDAGRNRIHVYRPDDKALTDRFGEMDWYGRIHLALEQNRFVLYAQKIVCLGEKQPYDQHVELLLRMANGGIIVPPMAFIPTAERYGVMPEIDRWVIRTAFAHIARCASGQSFLFSINLSGAMINDEKALPFIIEQFTLSGVRPETVCFEITETSAIANLLSARALIIALRTIGCKFALDDFGSGMSSFAYLKHLPVDYLKIDGSFVKDMASDGTDAALVSAINDIGHVMGIQTIAEFAESEDILTRLRTIGVDYAQGYGVGHPVAMKDLGSQLGETSSSLSSLQQGPGVSATGRSEPTTALTSVRSN